MECRQNMGRSIGAGIGAIFGAVVFDCLLIFVSGPWSMTEMGAALFGTVGIGWILGAVLGGALSQE
jgi:hypothetical protein